MTSVFYPLSKTLAWIANPSAWGLLLVLWAVAASRRPQLAAVLAGLGAIQLLVFSSPRVVDRLERWVASSVPVTYRPDRHYDAVIVLSGGDDRVRGGAEVVRGRGARLVHTGYLTAPQAHHIVSLLEAEGVDDRQILLAVNARNTNENALEAADLAARNGWTSIVIVTNALHMPRALACFHARGLEPDTLPVEGSKGAARLPRPRSWVPSPAVLDQSRAVLHEILGRLVYRAVGYSL